MDTEEFLAASAAMDETTSLSSDSVSSDPGQPSPVETPTATMTAAATAATTATTTVEPPLPAILAIDDEAHELLVTPSFKDNTPDVKFQQLQNEIELMKTEIGCSEETYHSKKSVLEKELRENETKYQTKIALFQKKVSIVSEEAKVNESSYKNELVLMKEKMQQMEANFEARLDTVQKSMARDYLMLQMQFEVIKRTNEKQGASLSDAKGDFDKARSEMKKVMKERLAAFHELQNGVHAQTKDFQGVREDCAAHKEEVEQMFQSWMTQHENLGVQVQGIEDVTKEVKDELVTAEEEREDTRSKMQKLGQTWESLFEHLVGQVHDHAEEQRISLGEQDKSRIKLEQKVEARHTLFEEILQGIQNEGSKQKLKTATVLEEIDKHEEDISCLKETISTKNTMLDSLEGLMKTHAQEQSTSRVKTTALQGDIDRLAAACTSRLDTIEADFKQGSENQSTQSEALRTELESNSFKLQILDQKVQIHESQLDEVSTQVQEQGEVAKATNTKQSQKLQDLEQILEDRKVEFDRLSSQVRENTEELKEENAVTSRSLGETAGAMRTQDARTEAAFACLRNEVGKLNATVSEIDMEKSAEKKVEGLLFEHGARLNNLNDVVATHGNELADLAKMKLERYETLEATMKETTEETKRELTGLIDLQKEDIINNVTSNIQKDVDEQKDEIGHVQKKVDKCTVEVSTLSKRAEELSFMLDDLARLVDMYQQDQRSLKVEFGNGQKDLGAKIDDKIKDMNDILQQVSAKTNSELQATNKALVNVNLEHKGSIMNSATALEKFDTSFAALVKRVEEQREESHDTRSLQTNAMEEMRRAMEDSNSQVASLKQKVDEDSADVYVKIGDLKTAGKQNTLDYRALVEKVEKYTVDAQVKDKSIKTLSSTVSAVQPYLEDLKSNVLKQGSELKSSREERSTMSVNLSKLTEVVDTQNKKLSSQIKEQVSELNAKHDVLKIVVGKQGTAQHEIETKLKKLTVETREKHETGLRVVGSKIHGTQLQIHDMNSEITKQSQEIKVANAEYEQFKAKTEMVLDVHSNQHSKTDTVAKQQAEALNATKTELMTSLHQLSATKTAVDRSLDAAHANLTKVTDDRMHEIEEKLYSWTSKFENIAKQIKSQAKATNSTQQDIEAVHAKIASITDTNVARFEELAKDLEETGARSHTVDVGRVDLENALSNVRQELNELALNVSASVAARSFNGEELNAQKETWDMEIATVLEQLNEQEAELQAMKADRANMQDVEYLKNEMKCLVARVEEQSKKLEKASEERSFALSELKATKLANKSLKTKLSNLSETQNSGFLKRQGLLKELIATSSDIKRELQFPLTEECRQDESSKVTNHGVERNE